MIQQKTIESLGNSDDRVDQKTGWNDDNTLGIPEAGLELKHMFTSCSYYGYLFIIYFNSVQ